MHWIYVLLQHDPKECQPTEAKGGKYIMYDKATTGTKQNNRKFSKCSIDSMVAVISKFIFCKLWFIC